MAIPIHSPTSSTSFFLLLTQLFFFHAHSITHWQDIQVLKQFKNGLDPDSVSPGSCLSTWDFTLDPCDNLFTDKFTCGFRCDVVTPDNTSRVTELALDQAGYSGPLASSTSWNLPYLQTLDLSNNLFTGPIPDSFANLTRLQRLSLSHNSLSGSLPSSLGSLLNLQEIYIDGNQINGTIPYTFNGLRDLKRLELQGNNLTGQFPDLSQLANLTSLDVSDNAVTGELPTNFPPSLFQITMRNNRLQGNISEALATKLPYLQVLDLSRNELAGSVPASLFGHPSLQQLILSDNSFGSVESPGLAGLRSELIEIDLSDNEIEGVLPGFMGIMPRLSALSLENNKISGKIPVEYAVKAVGPVGEVAGFERLLLGGNYLFGGIPGALLDLKPGRVMVDLGDNCLYRCPPSFFFCQGGQQKSLMECKKLP